MPLKFKVLSAIVLLVATTHSYADCLFNIQPLNFGVYNPIVSEDNISSSKIDISCSPSQTYTLKMSTGQSNNFNDRYMKSSDNLLHYNLYMDSGRSSLFGDGQSGTSYYTGQSSNVYIYAIIPNRQRIPAGSYTDYLSIDLSF